MEIVILILQILIFFGIAGTHSRIADIEQRLRVKNSFLDDDAWPQGDFLETPQKRIPKKPAKKIAVKQTTTLKKAHHASSQKRGNNGRFAKKVK